MRTRLVVVIAMVAFSGTVGTANATLWDRGGGLIYDDVLKITWLRDAKYAKTSGYDFDGRLPWYEARRWAENLVYYDSVRGVNWDDWRLPWALPINGVSYNNLHTYDGSTDRGYNLSAPGTVYAGNKGSELSYLYYNSLGNLAYYDVNGDFPQQGWGLQHTGPFINFEGPSSYYWTGSEYGGSGSDHAYDFYFNHGGQGDSVKDTPLYAWAVRDGDVSAVPEPSTMFLLGAGLIGLVGLRRRLKDR